MIIMKNFIERLHEYMRTNELSQKDFSSQIGCATSYISMILAGKKIPSLKFIEDLANKTGMPAPWWIYGKDDTDGFSALNMLVDMLIDTNKIGPKLEMDEDTLEMIDILVKNGIEKKMKLRKANK